jgi:hypothetical protein
MTLLVARSTTETFCNLQIQPISKMKRIRRVGITHGPARLMSSNQIDVYNLHISRMVDFDIAFVVFVLVASAEIEVAGCCPVGVDFRDGVFDGAGGVWMGG